MLNESYRYVEFLPMTQRVMKVSEAQQATLHLGITAPHPRIFFLPPPFPRPASIVKACGAVGSSGRPSLQHEHILLDEVEHVEQVLTVVALLEVRGSGVAMGLRE